MAPSRGKAKADVSNNPARTPRRATRSSTTKNGDGVPSVYQDLLTELGPSGSVGEESERPLKKRRVATNVSDPTRRGGNHARDGSLLNEKGKVSASPASRQQTLELTSDSEAEHDEDGEVEDDDDESDLAFEDIDLDQPIATAPREGQYDDNDEIEDISIALTPPTSSTHSHRNQPPNRTKPISAPERAFRLLVHKAHVLCLLGHCIYINTWCNNEVVQRHLRSKILSKRTRSYLNPKTSDSQFQRNRSFMDGLTQASEAYRGVFKITATGMRRARWSVPREQQQQGEHQRTKSVGEIMDLSEFIQAAKDLEGSQDTANQLFCALLRSVGVEARLVCSLQALPFGNDGGAAIAAAAKSSTSQQKNTKSTFYAEAPSGSYTGPNDSNGEDTAVTHSSTIGKVPSARRRLGQPAFTASPPPNSTPAKRNKPPIRKLIYPIFWTEAFNEAQQKWIPIDPIVTQTVAKPSKFEPPEPYEGNQMTYVIAFEEDGEAKDVTRRYSKAYNAKTRRRRVESTENGVVWLRKALRPFHHRHRSEASRDRDAIETAELTAKEAREGLPRNVQDFKSHPFYALERHLRRNEVLAPRREVGKLNAGTAKVPRMEAVFRREDVKVCRSAEGWWRAGRVVREGVVGLKRVPARRRPGGRVEREGSVGGRCRGGCIDDISLRRIPNRSLHPTPHHSPQQNPPKPLRQPRHLRTLHGSLRRSPPTTPSRFASREDPWSRFRGRRDGI